MKTFNHLARGKCAPIFVAMLTLSLNFSSFQAFAKDKDKDSDKKKYEAVCKKNKKDDKNPKYTKEQQDLAEDHCEAADAADKAKDGHIAVAAVHGVVATLCWISCAGDASSGWVQTCQISNAVGALGDIAISAFVIKDIKDIVLAAGGGVASYAVGMGTSGAGLGGAENFPVSENPVAAGQEVTLSGHAGGETGTGTATLNQGQATTVNNSPDFKNVNNNTEAQNASCWVAGINTAQTIIAGYMAYDDKKTYDEEVKKADDLAEKGKKLAMGGNGNNGNSENGSESGGGGGGGGNNNDDDGNSVTMSVNAKKEKSLIASANKKASLNSFSVSQEQTCAGLMDSSDDLAFVSCAVANYPELSKYNPAILASGFKQATGMNLSQYLKNFDEDNFSGSKFMGGALGIKHGKVAQTVKTFEKVETKLLNAQDAETKKLVQSIRKDNIQKSTAPAVAKTENATSDGAKKTAAPTELEKPGAEEDTILSRMNPSDIERDTTIPIFFRVKNQYLKWQQQAAPALRKE